MVIVVVLVSPGGERVETRVDDSARVTSGTAVPRLKYLTRANSLSAPGELGAILIVTVARARILFNWKIRYYREASERPPLNLLRRW